MSRVLSFVCPKCRKFLCGEEVIVEHFRLEHVDVERLKIGGRILCLREEKVEE
jgi:hypothetical protein